MSLTSCNGNGNRGQKFQWSLRSTVHHVPARPLLCPRPRGLFLAPAGILIFLGRNVGAQVELRMAASPGATMTPLPTRIPWLCLGVSLIVYRIRRQRSLDLFGIANLAADGNDAWARD
jgi:hypothetical protein